MDGKKKSAVSTPSHKLQFDLFYAALRALEGKRGHPLIDDPLAAVLVNAAKEPLSSALLAAGFPDTSTDDGGRIFLLLSAAGLMARYGDDFLAAELAVGTRQVVLFATGLDTRVYRLDWPDEATVYEVDYSHTLEFRSEVLRDQGTPARVKHHSVTASAVTASWAEDMCAAGFDPEQPTAWLIQPAITAGLAGSDHDVLFERIIELSAPGSAVNCDADNFVPSVDRWDTAVEPLAPDHVKAANFWMLTYPHSRMRPGDWLAGHGWTTSTTTISDIAAQYGRPLTDALPELAMLHTSLAFLTARLPL
ncbi:methyltransferase (TIGR00027 family) [Mycobacteroides chelonae]|nr:methyltransferase (TIGR00027 family) [Mycobacteroides chelonae]